MALDVKPCARTQEDPNALPIHKAKMYRRFQCVTHVLYNWLRQGRTNTTSTTTSSDPSRHTTFRKLWPTVGLLPKTSNYRQEYMNCIGPDVEISLEAAEKQENPPHDLQLVLARRFLKGRRMTVVTINRPPFVILKVEGEEIVSAKGFCMEMLNVMAKRFNFTYRLVLPSDGNWGSPMPNGTFNGMVGMVQRQVVDFAIASFTITYIRDTVIDFTHAFYEEPTTILIPPPSEQNNFLAFLEPFSWQVWALTLASILVVGPLLWVLANVGNLPVLYPHNIRNVSYSLSRYVWDCAFALASQSTRMRQTEPVRVLHGMWWTFCVILIYTYTGTLIAFLTVPRMTSLINSLEELANQRKVLWTYRAKTAHDVLFSNAEASSTYSKIGSLLKERPELIVSTDKEGVDAVLGGRTAFIKEKSWLDFAMEADYKETNDCRLAQVSQVFFSAGFGWVLQEDSLYLQLFNTEILKMSQSGLFSIWKNQYWPKPNKCTAGGTAAASGPKPLQLKNFSGHFFIFGVGLCLAFLAHVGEKVVSRWSSGDDGTALYKPGEKRRTREERVPVGSQAPVYYLRVIPVGESEQVLRVRPYHAHAPYTPIFRVEPPTKAPHETRRSIVQARPPIRQISLEDKSNFKRQSSSSNSRGPDDLDLKGESRVTKSNDQDLPT
ncbi:glutamate receptor ionotropic, delta-1-like [Homarus americanus]|uniref:glutamate receptor ionotropic, delta-1-like n=1 Tax=Homarus americanus TaxID=6706 RepID=UPI001C48575A|nr:glutamate receptor ionotropic, delta-1-like [Homarus americanus]